MIGLYHSRYPIFW